MKKFLLLLMIGFLAACEQAAVEAVPVLENESDTTAMTNLLLPEWCRLEDASGYQTVRVGFPMSQERLPNTGDVNIQVLFVDFPDYEGSMTENQIEDFFQDYIQGIVAFFDFQSFGRMTFHFERHPGFIRINEPTSSLSLTRASGHRDLEGVIRDAIRISDPFVDYSSTDMVIVFMNPDMPEAVADVSPAWPMSLRGAFQTNEGNVYNATIIAGDGVRLGYSTIAHEIGHLFGLVDLYSFNWQEDNPTNNSLFQFKYLGVFDFLSMGDPRQFGDNRDMLAWQRYLLDWITDEQVRCIDPNTSSESTYELIASHLDESGHKMIVLPFSRTKALVVEVKGQNKYCVLCSGGVYTYVVDTAIRNGNGPIRFVRPDHSVEMLFQDAYLSDGQQLIYENITITLETTLTTSIIRVNVE